MGMKLMYINMSKRRMYVVRRGNLCNIAGVLVSVYKTW